MTPFFIVIKIVIIKNSYYSSCVLCLSLTNFTHHLRRLEMLRKEVIRQAIQLWSLFFLFCTNLVTSNIYQECKEQKTKQS